jgi:exodeoxyribonuclease VII large subunit
VPVICGIGHAPDTCICDMVCDRRCSTPTAAAESVAPAFDEITRQFHERERRLARSMAQMLAQDTAQADGLAQRMHLAETARLQALAQRLEALAAHRCLQDPAAPLKERAAQLELSAERLHDVMPRMLARTSEALRGMGLRLTDAGPRLMRAHEAVLLRSAAQLDALSPLKVLARGYALAQDEAGHVVKRADALVPGDALTVTLAKGRVRAEVREVETTTGARDAAVSVVRGGGDTHA